MQRRHFSVPFPFPLATVKNGGNRRSPCSQLRSVASPSSPTPSPAPEREGRLNRPVSCLVFLYLAWLGSRVRVEWRPDVRRFFCCSGSPAVVMLAVVLAAASATRDSPTMTTHGLPAAAVGSPSSVSSSNASPAAAATPFPVRAVGDFCSSSCSLMETSSMMSLSERRMRG